MNTLPRNVFPEDWVYSNGKTPEEEALHRLYCQKLIKRILAHPELVPLGHTVDSVRAMLTDGSIADPRFQDLAFDAETYFEFKDEMAAKGIQVFNAKIEHIFSSEKVQKDRAQKMREYFLNHQSLLSDEAINRSDLDNPKFIKRSFYFLAEAWCFIVQQNLAGVELYLLDANAEEIKHFFDIIEPLIRCKNEGIFNE